MDYYFDRNEAVEEMFYDAWDNYQDLKEDDEEVEDYFSHPSLTAAERNPNLR